MRKIEAYRKEFVVVTCQDEPSHSRIDPYPLDDIGQACNKVRAQRVRGAQAETDYRDLAFGLDLDKILRHASNLSFSRAT
jgi:hypothetical protein